MNKTIRLVSIVGLLALLVGVTPPARGQESSHRDKKFYNSDYKSSRVDEMFSKDDNKASAENDMASTTTPTPSFSDVGNEATRHIDRMVAILGEMEKSLGDAVRTASTTQNTQNVASEPQRERATATQERPAQATETEEQAKPVSPMMDEQLETAPPDMYQPTMPEDIIGMPQQPGHIPERLVQPPMTNLPTEPAQEDLSAPSDMTEPSDMEDRPVPTLPYEVPPRIIEEEGLPSQPYTSEEPDVDNSDEPKQPEDSEDMLPDSHGSLDSDGNYIPPER